MLRRKKVPFVQNNAKSLKFIFLWYQIYHPEFCLFARCLISISNLFILNFSGLFNQESDLMCNSQSWSLLACPSKCYTFAGTHCSWSSVTVSCFRFLLGVPELIFVFWPLPNGLYSPFFLLNNSTDLKVICPVLIVQ